MKVTFGMERRPAKKKADDGNVIKGDWSGWVSCQLIPRLLYECTQELIVLSRQIGANLICSGPEQSMKIDDQKINRSIDGKDSCVP